MDDLLLEARQTAQFHIPDNHFHTEILWEEFKILDRLMYKYHNQQRRNVHFRRLKLLRRRLLRIKSVEAHLHWSVVLKNDLSKYQTILSLSSELIQQARSDCMAAYEALHSLLLDVLYVPFALICCAAVAKIFAHLGKFEQIIKAMTLDYHSRPPDAEDANRCDSRGQGKATEKRPFTKFEKLEEGWEKSMGKDKRKRFTKKKVKSMGDEIDDIFNY